MLPAERLERDVKLVPGMVIGGPEMTIRQVTYPFQPGGNTTPSP